MNLWEWAGLILFVLPWLIVGGVDFSDLNRLFSGQMTYSEYIWKDLDAWRAGTGSFPWRAVYLPALVNVSGNGLLLHFMAG